MKSFATVTTSLCLGIVTLFSVVSCGTSSAQAESANPDTMVEEPIVIMADSASADADTIQVEASSNATQIAHYTFDEADGAVLNDAIAYNNGNVSGKYWREAGVRGNALVLEEAQVEIADQPQLNHDLSPYSLSVWVNLETDSSIWIDKRDFQNQPKMVDGDFGGTFDHYVPLAGYSLWVTEHETDGTFINFFINQVGVEFKLQAKLCWRTIAQRRSMASGHHHR